MSERALTPAERMRRVRLRRKMGAIVVRLDVSPAVRCKLAAAGWGDDGTLADPHELAGEIGDFLQAWAEGRLRAPAAA